MKNAYNYIKIINWFWKNTVLNNNLKNIFFLNRSWPIRIWMWSAILCVFIYLIKFTVMDNPVTTEFDMIFMTYGLGSIAAFVLIYGFDWS